ncbi:TPA: hypothetical protein ACHJX8_004429 [Yersinia enterocolitica]|uniref:hypothetical protein n=1 Tax=Yersinia massiliensis TaxID=419257 RepID=UPI001562DE28|nr:hypothetical protein [Yersinia massiliensis]QKJ09265.1 hypothetical protein HRD68_00110 [Yersinia massiliensis]HDX9051752.1 hypothetical protein [Yersinia enterocolitica]
MKLSSLITVYDFMRYCRMPLWFQRSIRDMKVGDTFILGKYTQPISYDSDSFSTPQASDNDEACFVAEAWIERKRGGYSFHGTWTFPTKPERGFIMTFGEFKICKGGVIEFDYKNDAIRSFALVCRYLAKMLSSMSRDDAKVYKHSFPLFSGVWLDSDFIERRKRAVEVNGKIKRFNISYKKYPPTHQLSAIVDAAFALGLLPELN